MLTSIVIALAFWIIVIPLLIFPHEPGYALATLAVSRAPVATNEGTTGES